MRNKFRESKSDCTMDKWDKLFSLTTQECWCQHFSKISFNKVSRFKRFYEICLLLYNSAIQWQRLVNLLECSSLYFSSIRRIFSYLKSKTSNNSNWQRKMVKNDEKGKKWQNNVLLWRHHSLDDVICHQFYIINISVTL